jgi:GntR family carbon starvation induced transcriptional regulator
MWFKPSLDGIATGAAMSLDISDTQKITLASAIYEKLRDDIITGSQPPTHKLHIGKLCDRYSVGLSPMREALSRLSSEGLIKQTDRRGFSVAPVSLPELLDLTRARCWINEIGLRESIARGDQAWEEAVVLSFYRMQRTPRAVPNATTDRNPEWERAHREFHLSLVSGCGSDWIVGICDKLFDASERYRHWARRAGVVRSTAEEEHRAIMEAVVKRDSAAAIALLNAHFQRTAELVERVVAAGGAKQTEKKTASRAAAQSKVTRQKKRRTKD